MVNKSKWEIQIKSDFEFPSGFCLPIRACWCKTVYMILHDFTSFKIKFKFTFKDSVCIGSVVTSLSV